MKKNISILLVASCLIFQNVFSQIRFSLSTDFTLQRSFKKEQQFWAVGQNITGHWHFRSVNEAYITIAYFSPEKFNNLLSANAKSPSITPQQIFFTNRAQIRLKEFSLGITHYFKNHFDSEKGWAFYGSAGFGLLYGKAINVYSITIDTASYNYPERPVSGTGHFKRLTLDLGFGWEIPVANEVYFYANAKAWIPTTDYPSKYLFLNKNAPFVGTLSLGIRILF